MPNPALTQLRITFAVIVIGAGVLITLLDNEEYPHVGIGVWWGLQTVTTVGHGDVAPTNFTGRLVARR